MNSRIARQTWSVLSLLALGTVVFAQQPMPAETRPATRVTVTHEDGTAAPTRVSELIGREIQNPRGQRLGKIKELVVDNEDGRIAYAVVGFDVPAGSSNADRLWVVPWDVLRAHASQNGQKVGGLYQLDLDAERIAAAPGFAKTEWPVMDRSFGRGVYAYYGRVPYWERIGPIRHDGAPEDLRARAEDPPPKKPTAEDPNRTERDVPPLNREDLGELSVFPVGMFDPRNIRTLTGTVSSVIEQAGAESDFGVGIRLLVKRDDAPNAKGDTLVFVGPTDFVKKQGASFNQNDRVTLVGAEMDRDGRRVFVAQTITRGDLTMQLRQENGLPLWKRRTKPSGQ